MVKLTTDSKYNVKYGTEAVTKGSNRKNAHAVKALLGPGYIVWNRYTDRESKNNETL